MNKKSSPKKTLSMFLILSLFFVSLNVLSKPLGNTFSWNNQKLTLPFPKNWLSKKERTKEADPLVFLDIDLPNPRIVANIYKTVYSLSPTNLSAFKEEFLNSKKKWLKKNEGSLSKEIKFKYTSKFNTLRYEMNFTLGHGQFSERGIFMICPKTKGVALKVMIPLKRKARAKDLKITSFLETGSLCQGQ